MGLVWDPALLTGNRQIDDQHERIYQIFHDLRAVIDGPRGPAEARRVLGALSMYVVAHFRLEEDLMVQCGYLGLELHRAEHESLRLQAEELVDRFNAGGMVPMELLDFMERWLDGHVRGQDQPMVQFLLSVQGGR
jgi:hemerythrin